MGKQCGVARAPQDDVGFGRAWRFLLEGVQDIDRLGEARDVKGAKGPARADAQFGHARSDRGHGLPVEGLKPLLHGVQLRAESLAGVLRECLDRGARSADEDQRLGGHGAVYRNRYMTRKSGARI